ncbi:hypothetical protein DEAC_c23050 [Desulfosporosinus acididurans]|uniref:Restriction endonuclease type IV Mrr domain-containing protein n=1 Tax=Desulfosporosinus acididurans TaxID=476652 RepID=A0A0J1FQA2_9FIRM|nr:restriction endonuclease [Desulfosporosinus acididurans]KLU65675.1 hypothetical protein DEAC_c23050 [Desulfosporosinus acididurans]
MGVQEIFHYPPELTALLIDTIPLLCRSKKDVLLFFKGAGVPDLLMKDYIQLVNNDRDKIFKHEIVRGTLTRLNENRDKFIRERREVLKRVVEFENYSACWEADVLKAKGLVSEISKLINVKDSFTRMKDVAENERIERQKEHQKKLIEIQKRKQEFEKLKSNFYTLFGEKNPHIRGKKLESALNELFRYYQILIKEAFTLNGENSEGIVEQVDGVIDIDGQIYLVEMKWLSTNVDINDVSRHLVRLFGRSNTSGIFISASGYTEAAITTCADILNQKTIVLCKLEEIVNILENEGNLKDFFKEKIRGTVLYKKPLYSCGQ